MGTVVSRRSTRKSLIQEIKPQIDFVKGRIIPEDFASIAEEVGCTEKQVRMVIHNYAGAAIMPKVLNVALRLIKQREQMLRENLSLIEEMKSPATNEG